MWPWFYPVNLIKAPRRGGPPALWPGARLYAAHCPGAAGALHVAPGDVHQLSRALRLPALQLLDRHVESERTGHLRGRLDPRHQSGNQRRAAGAARLALLT